MLVEYGKVTELYIDGKRVPESRLDKYSDLINDTLADYEEAMEELEELDMENIEIEIEKELKKYKEIYLKKNKEDQENTESKKNTKKI
ncbi:MAG TPA: hypothetical protein DEQ09_02050 [Bacteroidales bacterium]|nr:hypothetical protein [Bacteroidales bacterium]